MAAGLGPAGIAGPISGTGRQRRRSQQAVAGPGRPPAGSDYGLSLVDLLLDYGTFLLK